MNYLLTCPKCNTNLKDFNKKYFDYHKHLFCNCKGAIRPICDAIFIHINDDSENVNINLYNEDIYLLFLMDEKKMYYSTCGTDIHIECFNYNDSFNDLELIDYMYKIYLKYKENEIFA
jgi:hypothetical protein